MHVLGTGLFKMVFHYDIIVHSIFSSHSIAAEDNGSLLHCFVVLYMCVNVFESQCMLLQTLDRLYD